MLALTDTALARLIIAATAIPHSRGRQWLKGVADQLDGDRAKQKHAARQARTRRRQRNGLRVYQLELLIRR
jgi:hypothetical protein